MQRHPFKDLIMHLDFLRVDATHAVHTNVPVHFINEEAVIKSGASVAHHITEIAVTCLPGNLPEFIEVDLADLEVPKLSDNAKNILKETMFGSASRNTHNKNTV